MRLTLLILLFTALSSLLSAQDFPSVDANDIPDCSILQESTFDGTQLWGYIDGGADVYLEYGFDKLLMQEFNIAGEKLRVDYYKMKTPEAAFGIFSISKAACDDSVFIADYQCVNHYQLQMASGSYYISIVNETSSQAAVKAGIVLAEKIYSKLKHIKYSFPDEFNASALHKNIASLKFFSGKLGIQNGFPEWEDKFEGFDNYKIFILPIEYEGKYINYSVIEFSRQEDAVRFCQKHKVNPSGGDFIFSTEKNLAFAIQKTAGTRIVFIESDLMAAGLAEFVQNKK